MPSDGPDGTPLKQRSDFWTGVASSVVSSLITAYIIFVVASAVGVAALGGAGAPVGWGAAVAVLLASMLFAASCSHLAWTGYLIARRQDPPSPWWLWSPAGLASVSGLGLASLYFPGYLPIATAVLALVLLATVVWDVWRERRNVALARAGGAYSAWLAINSFGSLIGAVGTGMYLSVVVVRALEPILPQ